MPRAALALTLFALAGCQEYEVTPFESVDVFFQDPPPAVDVLFVIDNSGSMAGYQLLVGLRFDEFLYWFADAGVDYRIAVTTTTTERRTYTDEFCDQGDLDEQADPGRMHLETVITPETPNAADVFRDVVNVGTCGSGDEQGLEAGRMFFSDELAVANSAFLRDEAALSIIYISDEQDASFDPVWAYANDLYGVKSGRDRDDVHASALTITDTEECIVPVFGSSAGTRYVAIADMMGGVVSNLCNNNWAETMVELSFEASRLEDVFVLTDLPKPESLQVTVGTDIVGCDEGEWTYVFTDPGDGTTPTASIVFDRDHLPEPGSRIAVRYDRGQGDPASFCPASPLDLP